MSPRNLGIFSNKIVKHENSADFDIENQPHPLFVFVFLQKKMVHSWEPSCVIHRFISDPRGSSAVILDLLSCFVVLCFVFLRDHFPPLIRSILLLEKLPWSAD